jgi:tetratricopeptide (TPR) repeat protein
MSNKASDNLHKLIKSMTKPEKRYFKVFSSRHIIGESNNYQVLFDAIDKQEEYDEVKLMKKFKDKSFVHRFSISKNRLYNALLKSLDSFHSNSSIEAQLQRQLHSVEILYHKSLYDQCLKLLQSARKVAEKHEKLTILVEMDKWEKRIHEKDNYENLGGGDQLKEILNADRDVVASLHAYNELWYVKSMIFSELYRGGKVRNADEPKRMKRIIDDVSSAIDPKHMNTENRYMLNHIHSAYHFSTGEYELCYPYLLENLKLIDKKPHLFREEPNIYISVLTNAIYVGMRLGKWSEALKNVEMMRELPAKLELQKNEDLELRLFALSKSTELTLYAQSGEFEKGIELIPSIEDGLEKFSDQLSSVRKAHFYFNIAVVHFGMENYHESLKWINQLLNNVEIDKTRDIHCMAQILNLVIHFELGNKSLLPYALRSTQRFLETRSRVYRFEQVMLNFIKETMKKRQDKSIKELMESLVAELELLRQDPFERTVFEYFDFLSWARSKTSGRKYRDLIAA